MHICTFKGGQICIRSIVCQYITYLEIDMNSIQLLSKKYKNSYEIIDDVDSIVYFLFDDVDRLLNSQRLILTWDAYTYSINITKAQIIKKQHLRGIKHFIGLETKPALRWLVSRLANNSVNYYKRKRYANDDTSYDESLIYDFLDIDKIQKNDPELFKLGLRKLSMDVLFRVDDFDWKDFSTLCSRYGQDPEEYALSPASSSAEASNSGAVQLLFNFYEDEDEDVTTSSFSQQMKILKNYKKTKQERLF